MPNVAIVRVSKELLVELLFPYGTEIHRVQQPSEMFKPDYLEFVVEHHSLPSIPENGVMPHMTCVHERIERRFQ